VPTPDTDPAILAGLRKALAGPLPLQVKGAADGLFPAGQKGKPLATTAVAKGWLAERKELRTTGAKRKTQKEVVVGWELTDAGRQHLAEADSPKPILEALLPVLHRIADRPVAPPAGPSTESFGRAVADATATCVRAIEESFAKLQKAIEGEFERLHKAVGASQDKLRPAVQDALGGLQATFAAATPTAEPPKQDSELAAVLPVLRAVLTKLGGQPTLPPPPPRPTDPPIVPPPVVVTPDRLRETIEAAYRELCLYVEFRDKLIEIPRLYQEVARQLPGLTVRQFHEAVETLQAERRVDLKVLNEVRAAKNPEQAIRKDDRLYYVLIWN
jgi:hypothetical protein